SSVPDIKTNREEWKVQKVIVCNGADFGTLYPEVFEKHRLTKCKLQMMKAVPLKPVTLGPSLCAGLTLGHYAAFAACPSLQKVHNRYDAECIGYKEHGIHVLVSQNGY